MTKILPKQTELLQSRSKYSDKAWDQWTTQAELDRDFIIFLVRVHGSLDKAYHDDVWLDHACPFTIRASTRIPVHRVPNVVGVGLAKCGTGTLAFLGKFWVESNPNSPHFGRTPISPSLHLHFTLTSSPG